MSIDIRRASPADRTAINSLLRRSLNAGDDPRYDAAYLPCMSAEQGRSSHIATSTFFPPTPPGLIPPLIELPSFTFPPMLPTAPAGVQSVPASVGPPSGLTVGPG